MFELGFAAEMAGAKLDASLEVVSFELFPVSVVLELLVDEFVFGADLEKQVCEFGQVSDVAHLSSVYHLGVI